MPESKGKRTALYQKHLDLGAKIVPFGGFDMPLQYSGQIAEHQAVRTGIGIFDLSHMGEFRLRGPEALAAADRLVTNRVLGTEPGQAVYSPMCREDGGIVDDLIVYHLEDSVWLVVNAANIDKDREWVKGHLPPGVEFRDESDHVSLIAVQGPETEAFLNPLVSVDISGMETYTAVVGRVAEIDALISRTGYTGEDGFELYVSNDKAPALWDRLFEAGGEKSLTPVGLAARDTLRFEMGYCLYGNELDDETSPLEAGLGWTVKLDTEFIGAEALRKQKEEGLRRRLVGLAPEGEKVIPRSGYPVLSGEKTVGRVTSGTYSPSLERGLGMAYVETALAGKGEPVSIDVRGRRQDAKVTRVPFYTRGSRKTPPRRK